MHSRTSLTLQNLAKFDKVFLYQTHWFGMASDIKQEIVTTNIPDEKNNINQQYFWKIFIRHSLSLILDSMNASKIRTRHWKSWFKFQNRHVLFSQWIWVSHFYKCVQVSVMFLKIASHTIHMKCTLITCAHFISFKIRTNNVCNSSQDKLKHL